MCACLVHVFGLGTCLLLVGTSNAADNNAAAADAAADVAGRRPPRFQREIGNDPNTDVRVAMEGVLQEIANSPPSAPRFAAQLGVAEQPEDCIDYPGAHLAPLHPSFQMFGQKIIMMSNVNVKPTTQRRKSAQHGLR